MLFRPIFQPIVAYPRARRAHALTNQPAKVQKKLHICKSLCKIIREMHEKIAYLKKKQ